MFPNGRCIPGLETVAKCLEPSVIVHSGCISGAGDDGCNFTKIRMRCVTHLPPGRRRPGREVEDEMMPVYSSFKQKPRRVELVDCSHKFGSTG